MEHKELTIDEWKELAWKLLGQCRFALERLKPNGWTGLLMYENEDGTHMETKHWRDEMMDVMELIPGVKVDRELVHAFDLSKREREKLWKERSKKEVADGK